MIYDDVVRDSAQVRVDLAVEFIRDLGAAGEGEVGDADPFNAAMDATRAQPIDEIIVSTLPETASGWLRRDLIERLQEATGVPVEHVVVDLAAEGLPFGVTLVVANLTVAAPELVERLKALAEEGPRRFIVVVPQSGVQGHRVREARQRARRLLAALDDAGIVAAGMIGDPDPYTAIMNAVQYFHISEIVISTLPEGSSQWVADKLVDRVRGATNVPVEHIESPREGGGLGGRRTPLVAHDAPRRPPSRAARGQPFLAGRARLPRDAAFHHLGDHDLRGLLHGLLLHPGRGRRRLAAAGDHLPKLIAGFNTAILISSSFTIHFAQESIKKNNRLGLQLGMVATFLLGLTFLFIQINEYVHIGFSPQDHAQGSIFYGLTGLHGAHVTIGLMLLAFVTIRAFRGHFSADSYHGMEVPGIYWHFVDVMWIVVYFTVYII